MKKDSRDDVTWTNLSKKDLLFIDRLILFLIVLGIAAFVLVVTNYK